MGFSNLLNKSTERKERLSIGERLQLSGATCSPGTINATGQAPRTGYGKTSGLGGFKPPRTLFPKDGSGFGGRPDEGGGSARPRGAEAPRGRAG